MHNECGTRLRSIRMSKSEAAVYFARVLAKDSNLHFRVECVRSDNGPAFFGKDFDLQSNSSGSRQYFTTRGTAW